MALPLALPLAGAALGGLGAMMGQSSQNQQAQQMSNMLGNAWQPVSTNTGAATASFDPSGGGSFSTALTGDTADWQKQLFQQAMGGANTQGADIFGQGQGMLTNAMNAPQVDVAGMAGEQNALLQQLAQPQQDRDAGGLMAQMLASGRLGSSGGQGMFGQLQQSQDMADMGRSSQAISQAQQAAALQDQINQGMFGQGMGLMGFGNQMTQQDMMNRMNAGNQATGLFDLSNQAGMLSQGVGDRQFQGTLAQTNALAGTGSDPFASFIGGLGGGLGMFGGQK